ncbi:MAG: hypothetical protein KDB82_06800 [Planctomycetes bacterium]|nr:hypothetical protein [Planctomycetota bacterium]
MHKDRLILLLMLTVFVLLGADCQAPWDKDKDKERPLPDRALASHALLRAYYNTRTFPEEMRSIKVPEAGDHAQNEDDYLTVEFDMGSATVEEVRVHWYLTAPPGDLFLSDTELLCRVEAPNGTKSGWKTVDTGNQNDLAANLEIDFQYEFDGMDSAGRWKAEIYDYVGDADGRCLFRNASMHINRGEPTGVGGSPSEADTLNLASGNYGSIPEAAGQRMPFDIGWFGTGRMLANDFTFASTFYVESATVSLSIYYNANLQPATELWALLVSPSGNWAATQFPDTADQSNDFGNGYKLDTYNAANILTFPNTANGPLMNLNGEISTGTWTLYVVDTEKNGQKASLSNDLAGAPNPVAGGNNITLTLSGVS